MDALKPCPFCDSHDIRIDASRGYATGRNIGKYSYSVTCHGCSVELPWVPTEEESIAAWNRRDGQ